VLMLRRKLGGAISASSPTSESHDRAKRGAIGGAGAPGNH